ncbi:CAP domain-containing protein [Paenibacillus sp. GCM10012303]|uniref:CAP domain-containing protein n=1 Tax=Paenibacillus sp. GCM10012303 TaxID=3317340 RepID=UPI00361D3C5E
MRFKKTVMAGVLALSVVAGTSSAFAATSYTVNHSDTMWKISQRYGVSLQSLIQANPHVANPNIVWPGMKLVIPGTGSWYGGGNGSGDGNGGGTGQGTGSGADTSTPYADQVVTLVNQERAKAGLKPLANDPALTAMAMDKAKDMYNNNYFDHNSPTYGSPFDMMRSYGIRYTYAGENIAKGQRNPQEVMNAWMNSPGHRQNIMSPNFTKIGVAYYNGEWVQEFIAN